MRKAILSTALAACLALLAAAPTPRAAPAASSPPSAATLADAQGRLAGNLLRQLSAARAAPATITVSPASLAAVMGLVDLGANQTLRRAIHRALGFERPGATADADLAALREAVAPLTKAAPDSPLGVVNAVIFDVNAPPRPLAELGLKQAGADVSVTSLDDPKAFEAINKRVADATHGLIPTLIEEPPQNPGFVALNALAFKATWRTPFDPKLTTPAPFTKLDGGKVDVPLMHGADRSLLFRRDGRFLAAQLPYTVPGYTFVVVTTTDKPATAAEFAGVAGWLSGNRGFSETIGDVALPRMTLSSGTNLLPAMDALGLRPARVSRGALRDLSRTPQTIAQIVQKTVIAVDEAGTEAAAATAVTAMRTLALDHPSLVADKPFLYGLRHDETGLLLLAGYVGDPSAPH